MAFATVFLIPEMIEPVFWVAIFIFCAYIIVKACPGKYFLHGFLVSMVNCVWITAAHIIFYSTYIASHPNAVKEFAGLFLPTHPRLQMLIMGPVFGVGFGLILGLFSFIASNIVTKKATAQ